MDDLPRMFQELQSAAMPVTPDDLKTYGKVASAAWRDGRYKTIGESVVEVIKSAALSPEQVRRVVEFANTESFLVDFHQKTATNCGSGYVDFGPGVLADPGEVLRNLNDGTAPTTTSGSLADYDIPPEAKVASEIDILDTIFPNAKDEALPVNADREVRIVSEKLAQAADTISGYAANLAYQYREAASQMVKAAKTALIEGESAADVLQAWGQSGADPASVKLAFAHLVHTGKVDPKDLGESLGKTASYQVVNPEHPVVSSFVAFKGVTEKLAQVQRDEAIVREGMATWAYMQKKYGSAQLMKYAAGEKALWPALKEMAAKASVPVGNAAGWATKKVIGENAAPAVTKAVSKAVEYSPHAVGATAAGLGGYQMYDIARTSPNVQAALSVVPGTQQASIRSQIREQEGMMSAQNRGMQYYIP